MSFKGHRTNKFFPSFSLATGNQKSLVILIFIGSKMIACLKIIIYGKSAHFYVSKLHLQNEILYF
jgi:hypothetical protein